MQHGGDIHIRGQRDSGLSFGHYQRVQGRANIDAQIVGHLCNRSHTRADIGVMPNGQQPFQPLLLRLQIGIGFVVN